MFWIHVQVRRPDLEVRILVRQLGWFEVETDHTDGGGGEEDLRFCVYARYSLSSWIHLSYKLQVYPDYPD